MKSIIGVTGKSGSGKTALSTKIADSFLDATVINIDTIGYAVLCRPDVLETLKRKLGDIDIEKLGEIVFTERENLNELWVPIRNEISDIIGKAGNSPNRILIFDWILLPQYELWDKCDIKILVESDFQDRKRKVIKRDGISNELFEQREKASIEYLDMDFDYVFFNDYSEESMRDAIKNVKKIINE